MLDGSVEIEEGSKRTTLAAGASRLVTRGDAAELPPYEILLRGAKLTLGEAIARATQSAPGAVALHAELETDKGRIVFSIEIAVGARTLCLKLDARDGKILDRDDDERDEESKSRSATIPLAEAVERALRKAPGRAVEAEMKASRIEVKVVVDGKLMKVRLDGRTGDILELKED